MAFFGMLIGNGHCIVNNETQLLKDLEQADIFNIIIGLNNLNQGQNGPTAGAVYNNDDNAHNELNKELTRDNGFTYNVKKQRYYLIGGDSNKFATYISKKVDAALKKVDAALNCELNYDNVVNMYVSPGKLQYIKDKLIMEGLNCGNGQGNNVKAKIDTICKAINDKVKNKRIELLRKLLTKTMQIIISKLESAVDEGIVREKTRNEIYVKLDKKYTHLYDDTDEVKKYIDVLKGEVTDELLNEVMDENKNEYEKKIADLKASAKPAKVVTTTLGGGSGGKPSMKSSPTPAVKKTAGQRMLDKLAKLKKQGR